MGKSIKSQIAQRYGVKKTIRLVAVLFYSDRSYTQVTVFGTQLAKFQRYVRDLGEVNQSFNSFGWAGLKEVPEGGYLLEASTFGLKEGKVLAVPGFPPKT